MHNTLITLAATALCLTAGLSGAQQVGEGLLLAMKVSKSGTEMMSPTVWAPLGATSRITNDRGMTIEVTGASSSATTVFLQLKVTEGESGKSTTTGMDVELQLGADATIVVRKGTPDELVIQVKPRMSARPT